MALNQVVAKSSIKNNSWDSITLLTHTKDVVRKALDLFACIPDDLTQYGVYLKNDDFQVAVIKACVLHDLGKMNWKFQDKLVSNKMRKSYSDNWKAIADYFMPIKNIDISPRHEIYSILWSLHLLNMDDPIRGKIQTAILYHHYNSFYAQEIQGGIALYDGMEAQVAEYLRFVKTAQEDLTEVFLNDIASDFLNNNLLRRALEEMKQASQQNDLDKVIEAFEWEEDISEQLQLFEGSLENITNEAFNVEDYVFLMILGCLHRSDYAASGYSDVEKPFTDLYKGIQKSITDQIHNHIWQLQVEFGNASPSEVSIVKAPTGSGKTELALIWAANQNKKLFYTLPLRVALNDIYQKRFVDSQYGYFKGNEDKVSLLHSTAFLEYMRGKQDVSVGEKVAISRMLSNALYLSTVDQVFLSSLLYYGSDKLFALYPYSCFVIDEIQSYQPEMMAVLFKTMAHMRKLGAPILVITATLPPYITPALKSVGLSVHSIPLPLNTSNIKNYSRKRHRLWTRKEWLSEEQNGKIQANKEVIKEIIEDAEGKNILIIVNNVNKAIAVFEAIQSLFIDNDYPQDKLFLLHSRILESEKTRRIKTVKESTGEGEKGFIVVSTQLIEASVDFDFDVLQTEWCPIDSLVQRMGRIYRNRDKDFDGSYSNVVVYLGKDAEPDRFTSFIYSQNVLIATRDILLANQQETLIDFKVTQELIQAVFDKKYDGISINDVYVNEIEKHLDFLKYFKASKRSEAQRIFRKLAGRTLVVINEIIDNEEFGNKPFGNYLKDHFERGSLFQESDKSWKQIFGENDKFPNVAEPTFSALQWLLNASISIPEYHFYKVAGKQQFKDYYLIYLNNDNQGNKKFDELKRYGYDKVKGDLDKEELSVII